MTSRAVLDALPLAAAIVSAQKANPDARRKFQMLPLYQKQQAIIDDPARFTITEATTKAGKTMSHIEWLLSEASKAGEGEWWWVATIKETADIAFRRTIARLQGFIDSCGQRKQVCDPIAFEKNETRKIVRAFGATIWFKSADEPDSLYGEDVRAAVGDEISRWRDPAWHALYTTLAATKGRAKLIGNMKGRKNVGYQLARKAEGGEPDWSYHRLTALDAIEGGILDADIVQQAERHLPKAVFRELFMAEASDDQGNPFGLDSIRACANGLWTTEPAVWGWDLAKSVDWTVGVGMDHAGRVCRFERFQRPWQETLDAIDAHPAQRVLVDSTGVGDPIVEALQRRGRSVEGFKFTAQSKQQLMEGLAVAIQQRAITFPDGPIRNELEAYEYEYTRTGVRYSAPEGMHDDCVCALALAWHALGSRMAPPKIEDFLVRDMAEDAARRFDW